MREELVYSGTPLRGHLPPARQATKTPAPGPAFLSMIRAAAAFNEYRDLQALHAAGATAKELSEVGYPVSALQSAGYSLNELLSADIAPAKLRAAGINPNPDPSRPNIAPPPSLPPAPPPAPPAVAKPLSLEESVMARLERLDMSAQKLRDAQFTARELKDIVGLSDANVKQLGLQPDTTPHTSLKEQDELIVEFAKKAQRSKAFSASQLRSMGLSATHLAEAEFSLAELRQAGFSPQELREAKFSIAQLKAAGFSGRSLLRAGTRLAELRAAGFSSAELAGRTQITRSKDFDATRAARLGRATDARAAGMANTTKASAPSAQASSSSESYRPGSFSMGEDPRAYQSERPSVSSNNSSENPGPHPG